MRWHRIAVAFMLSLALLPTLSVIPSNVSGQGYVTITTQATTTGFYTSPVTTRYETITTSSYVYRQLFTFYSDVNLYCQLVKAVFFATQGQKFQIQVTPEADNLDFYIGDHSFYIVPYGGTCKFLGAPLYTNPSSSVGSVDWVAPSTGQYIVWLVRKFAGSRGGVLSIAAYETTTVPSISYITAPTTEVLALTTTISQVALPFGYLGLLVVGAAVIAGVLVVARRRKSSVKN